MTPRQFTAALSGRRINPDGKATKAARMVLVDGLSRREAARTMGLHLATVANAVKRIQPDVKCPTCGRPM